MAQALASCSAMQLAAASGLGVPLGERSRASRPGTKVCGSARTVVSLRAQGQGEERVPVTSRAAGPLSLADSLKPVSLSLAAGLATALPAQAIESTDIVDALEKVMLCFARPIDRARPLASFWLSSSKTIFAQGASGKR